MNSRTVSIKVKLMNFLLDIQITFQPFFSPCSSKVIDYSPTSEKMLSPPSEVFLFHLPVPQHQVLERTMWNKKKNNIDCHICAKLKKGLQNSDLPRGESWWDNINNTFDNLCLSSTKHCLTRVQGTWVLTLSLVGKMSTIASFPPITTAS